MPRTLATQTTLPGLLDFGAGGGSARMKLPCWPRTAARILRTRSEGAAVGGGGGEGL